ncbi:MAG: sporulation integral membrane protein YlbJ [Dethiobacter sp.]|jgi:sporulation integral membrane protein YlbJ|nr:MAG: sporulation integral membrane protein YlbJ [Dethiobacter sp.]
MFKSFRKQFLYFYLPGIMALLITIAMVIYPKEAFEAALNGLAIWWNIVFPALLPFFIFSQVLIGLGVVHFLGVLLEPVMRPVFNVPGTGSFVMAMGLASGFPIGAVLTSKLRQQKLCNKVEAERLISFVNTADPLFMFGAVAVGMLHAPQTGFIIAAAHYLSSISVGLVMRFYKARQSDKTKKIKREHKNIFIQALKALVKARQEDSRPIGRLLGEAIRDSINTLMLIGGFIILFSVIISMMDLFGVVRLLSSGFSHLLFLIGLNTDLAPAFISGLFEIDLGCQLASTIQNVAMDQRIIALSAIIAWSGLSVHAQVASIISSTDINIFPYICARVLHAVLAGLYCLLLLGPFQLPILLDTKTLPVFWQTIPHGSLPFWYERTVFMGGRVLVMLASLLVISLLIYYFEKINIKTGKANFRRF